MTKKVNLHYKRFSEFLTYLKEHDAEITIHHQSSKGNKLPITYSFHKDEPHIKSLLCEAIDENESVVNEYFRKNIESHHISTRKRKIFFDKVNVIHDIQTILPDTYDPVLQNKLLRGDRLDHADLLALYPGLDKTYYEMVTRFFWNFLFEGPQKANFTPIPSFIFSEEIAAIHDQIHLLREDEHFVAACLALITSAANSNTSQPHYPDYSFLYDPAFNNGRHLNYEKDLYESEIPLDEETSRKVFYGSYLFRDIPVTERPAHYLAHVIFAYYEYFTLNILATYLVKKEDIRFRIYTSLDGINIEYSKDQLSLNELADELVYYHFHKDPEKIFSTDLSHLLNEEIKKNKTDNFQNAVDASMIKAIIQNRSIDTFSQSFLKTFGFRK